MAGTAQRAKYRHVRKPHPVPRHEHGLKSGFIKADPAPCESRQIRHTRSSSGSSSEGGGGESESFASPSSGKAEEASSLTVGSTQEVGGGGGVPSGVSGSSERNGRGRAAIESTREYNGGALKVGPGGARRRKSSCRSSSRGNLYWF